MPCVSNRPAAREWTSVPVSGESRSNGARVAGLFRHIDKSPQGVPRVVNNFANGKSTAICIIDDERRAGWDNLRRPNCGLCFRRRIFTPQPPHSNRGMTAYDSDAAIEHLRTRDRKLARLISKVGTFEMRRRTFHTPFHALFSAIVSQQLSGKAAHSIYQRTRSLFPRGRITAPAVLNTEPDDLRSAGLSRAKTAALHDLASKYADGTLPNARRMKSLSDDEIIDELVQVRGIGRWTVEMLLIFYLGRPDVLPVGDLGVRKGFQIAYARAELPTEEQLLKHGERWRPYRSVASWYLWRATDPESPRV